MDYRRYKVRGSSKGPLLDFVLGALRESGCTILRATPPTEAPFRITFETPAGERMGIVVYAFRATFTPTKNRPQDEHSFQIKYEDKKGGDERHRIWQDPFGLYTTLFLGINPDLGFFVAADPVVHDWTKFHIRLEFKQEQVEQIQQAGWYAWERKRFDDLEPLEVLVGGTASQFLQYVRFERAACGMDQGHRQLLAEKLPTGALVTGKVRAPVVLSPVPTHALAREFEMSEKDVLDLIASTRMLKTAVRGWVAEEHLVKALSGVDGVSDCVRSDEGGPDVLLRFRGSRELSIQCKNVARKAAADGTPRMDLQRSRRSEDPCRRLYKVDEYDLFAACLHAVSERWQFRYANPRALDPHKDRKKECKGRLSNNVRVDDRWIPDAAAALAAIV